MLGLYLAPDGNNKDQVKYMQKKGNHMGNFNTSRGCPKERSKENLKLNNPLNHEITLI